MFALSTFVFFAGCTERLASQPGSGRGTRSDGSCLRRHVRCPLAFTFGTLAMGILDACASSSRTSSWQRRRPCSGIPDRSA